MPEQFPVVSVEVNFEQQWSNGDSEQAWPFLDGKEFISTTTLRDVLGRASGEIEDAKARRGDPE